MKIVSPVLFKDFCEQVKTAISSGSSVPVWAPKILIRRYLEDLHSKVTVVLSQGRNVNGERYNPRYHPITDDP